MSSRILLSLEADRLATLAAAQANRFFPDDDPVTPNQLRRPAKEALSRLEFCFSHIANKYFFDGHHVRFDHLHGDQYAMWLYFLSNEAYKQGTPARTCSKLFLLNKALHGCDVYYEVELPEIFLLVHPLATVLGRARYSNYFVAYQRCGVGSNHDVYPTFGEHVTLRPGSAVLGNSTIGNCCQIAAESLVIDRHLPDHSLYFGTPKTCIVKRQETPYPLWRI